MNFGKGMYLWKLIYCEGGNPQAIADVAHAAGLSHVLFKIANWQYSYNVSADIPAIVAALKAKGIAVWGWHYIALNDPTGEGAIAVSQVNKFGLDGYCIDAEGECKHKPAQTWTFMEYLKDKMKVPIALSTYRYPYLHLELAWKTFLLGCDYLMPQVYWMQAHNPAEQLQSCYDQYIKLQNSFGLKPLPMIPTGAAFYEYEWKPTVGEVNEFMNKAVKLGFAGFNFWEWWHSRVRCPELWPEIAKFSFGTMPPPEPTPEQKLEILWREAKNNGWNLSI